MTKKSNMRMATVAVLIAAVAALLGVAACNLTVGDCYPVGSTDGNGDPGGGVISSGAGAGPSGDAPTGQSRSALSGAQCNASDSGNSKTSMSAAPPADGTSTGTSGAGGSGTTSGECGTSGLGGLGATQSADGASYWDCSGPCANNCPAEPQMGWISPDAFHFVTVLPDDGKGSAGGWQSSPAVLSFRRWTGLLPEAWTCPQFTIGMPVRTQMGVISPSYAASVSAAVANLAMDRIMHPPNNIDPPQGVACNQLKPTMQQIFDTVYGPLGAKLTTP
jgi:hypothetical protein